MLVPHRSFSFDIFLLLAVILEYTRHNLSINILTNERITSHDEIIHTTSGYLLIITKTSLCHNVHIYIVETDNERRTSIDVVCTMRTESNLPVPFIPFSSDFTVREPLSGCLSLQYMRHIVIYKPTTALGRCRQWWYQMQWLTLRSPYPQFPFPVVKPAQPSASASPSASPSCRHRHTLAVASCA